MAQYKVDEFPPLLFTIPSEQPAVDYYSRTPRTAHSPIRGGDSSLSRRSLTPPGSAHTDNTPPRPPPRERLSSMMLADAGDLQPPGSGQQARPAATPTAAAASTGMIPLEAPPQTHDTWVTIFGFTPSDLPIVLKEFQKCGDILQWGTFGASPQSNFIHIQYQTPYCAQRALLRAGEQLSSSLIIGVKPLDPRHKQLIDAFDTHAGSPAPRVGAPAQPARPYKVDMAVAQGLPQPSRTLVQKLSQFVLGV